MFESRAIAFEGRMDGTEFDAELFDIGLFYPDGLVGCILSAYGEKVNGKMICSDLDLCH